VGTVGAVGDAAHRRGQPDSSHREYLYALKGSECCQTDEELFWRVRRGLCNALGNPAFLNAFDRSVDQVHSLGAWDTVKSVGWLSHPLRRERSGSTTVATFSSRGPGLATAAS